MKDLVFLKSNQPVTTSLIIADGTGNQHESIIRLINEHKAHFERWGQVRFSDLKSGNSQGGRPTKVAYLNEQQATFLITLLRNNDVVLEFKSELVDRFYKMREILLNQQNEQWRELRNATKISFKDLTPVIRELHEWATAHGCKVSEKVFFMNFFKLINKTLGINPNSRDTLAAWQLYEVDKLQFIARTIITGLLTQGADYHLPYRNCKDAFETYARLSYINQRLLNQ